MLNFIGLLSLPDRISFNGGAKRQLGGEGQDGVSFFAILQCALALTRQTHLKRSPLQPQAQIYPSFSSHGVEAKVDDAEPTKGSAKRPLLKHCMSRKGIAETV